MKQITKRKKNQTHPKCKHLQITNLVRLKTEICLRKTRKHSEHCHIINCKRCNEFAGRSIYRQIGIPAVTLIRKTIATKSFIIFVPDQLNDFSHFSLRPGMQ